MDESGRRDSNPRPPGPKPGALPDCATPRYEPSSEAKTPTQDKLLPRAPEEYLNERPERSAAVRDAVLRRRGSLTEGHLQLGRVKQRVVAEPARPSGLRQDKPVTRGFHDLGHAARRREERHDTTIAGPPALLGDAGELL